MRDFYVDQYVDGTPIREFKHFESSGVAYLKSLPMRIYSSLSNADIFINLTI